MKHAATLAEPAAARAASPRRRWWLWLRLVAALAILAALVSLLGTKAFAAGLHVLGPGSVLAALVIGLATTVLTALRWRLVARRVGLQLRLGDAVIETYRAIFLNAVLPGGVLGDVDRAVRHGRSSGDLARGARVVAIERSAGQLVLIVAALVVIPAEPAVLVEIGDRVSRAPLIGLGLLVLALVVAGALLARARRRPGWRAASGSGWRSWLHDTAADVRTGALARSAWPALLGLSAAALAGYLLLFLVAARAAGATAPVLTLLPPLLLALIAMGLPISVGGWGPREGMAAFAFWMAGLGAPLGVTTSVAYGALALISASPGALVLLARRMSRARRAEPAPAPQQPVLAPQPVPVWQPVPQSLLDPQPSVSQSLDPQPSVSQSLDPQSLVPQPRNSGRHRQWERPGTACPGQLAQWIPPAGAGPDPRRPAEPTRTA